RALAARARPDHGRDRAPGRRDGAPADARAHRTRIDCDDRAHALPPKGEPPVTANEIARLLDEPELRGEVSAVELAEALLERIEATREINAFITVTAERALADARRIDAAWV